MRGTSLQFYANSFLSVLSGKRVTGSGVTCCYVVTCAVTLPSAARREPRTGGLSTDASGALRPRRISGQDNGGFREGARGSVDGVGDRVFHHLAVERHAGTMEGFGCLLAVPLRRAQGNEDPASFVGVTRLAGVEAAANVLWDVGEPDPSRGREDQH
jgi:hypothetical protein